MPSITITNGLTFNNLGPVTTTFTAAPSCTTAINNYGIGLSESLPYYLFEAQCTRAGYNGCYPPGTVSEDPTPDRNPTAIFIESYYSPGLYCPSGWKTAGVAARHGDKTVSFSGVLDIPTPIGPDYGPTTIASAGNPVKLLPKLLDPSETLVMCCPNSMVADPGWGCYSILSDYKVTTGCAIPLPMSLFGTSTATHIVNGTTSLDYLFSLTRTDPVTATMTTFDASETPMLGAASFLPMIRLIHHQSDLKATGTADAGSTSAASTSNSAARLSPNVNSWDGMGGVLGVSLAAIVLGATMVLQ
ncbi:hypothetical protein N7517_003689 [Penicillium concentricum]|uniref:Uncharacterized protein n=1 Tax=Penicillium concentricum TaxID=293559 RepID=A0A9W9S8Q9_9EURO|nr:uncharacterized protein N7517_003689 [Penicillium concentricum]KAJ5371683.1 hypothetical protein N7517_003689 [Penicillium concentricum]